MTTTADLIAATERLLFSGDHEETNYLAADYTASAATLTIANPAGGIQPGARIAIGLEVLRVKSVSALTVTVDGAQEGSGAANHATGDAITVDPKFSRLAILDALNAELASLSSPSNGLYKMVTADITYNSALDGYDLGTATFIDLYDIEWKETGSRLDYTRADWDVIRNLPTTDFASGTALFIRGVTNQQPMRVTYKVAFGRLAALTDDVETIGLLPATAHDIPPLGAAWRLVTASEARRNFTDAQGDSKRASEVPAGAQRQAGIGFKQMRDERIKEEAVRLRAAYPRRRRW